VTSGLPALDLPTVAPLISVSNTCTTSTSCMLSGMVPYAHFASAALARQRGVGRTGAASGLAPTPRAATTRSTAPPSASAHARWGRTARSISRRARRQRVSRSSTTPDGTGQYECAAMACGSAFVPRCRMQRNR
jgi:hypothetical protein